MNTPAILNTVLKFNILLIGPPGVGKSTFATYFTRDFDENVTSGSMIWYIHCIIPYGIHETEITLTIMEDTCIPKDYSNIHGVIVMYDISDQNSYINMKPIVDILNNINMPVVVTGNKLDKVLNGVSDGVVNRILLDGEIYENTTIIKISTRYGENLEKVIVSLLQKIILPDVCKLEFPI